MARRLAYPTQSAIKSCTVDLPIRATYNYFLEFMRISEIVKDMDTNSSKMKKVEEVGVVLDVI